MACDNGTCYNVGCGYGTSSSPCNCGSNCSDECSSCYGTCKGCSGSCSGGCDGCSGGCSDTCASGCTNGCTSCDTGCSSVAAIDLYNILVAGLNKKILAADLTNINAMIQSEANRRNKSTTSQTFTTKEKATSTKIKALQDNLKTIGYSTTKDAGQKVKSWEATGKELIDKALSAYEETISHS